LKSIIRSSLAGVGLFAATHVIVNQIVIYLYFLTKHPLTPIYRAGNVFLYIFLCAALFLPIYFLGGLLTKKIFRATNISLVAILIASLICEALMILAWMLISQVAQPGDQGAGFMTLVFNSPAIWAFNSVNFEDTISPSTIIFYILPSIGFFLGMFAGTKLLKKKKAFLRNEG